MGFESVGSLRIKGRKRKVEAYVPADLGTGRADGEGTFPAMARFFRDLTGALLLDALPPRAAGD
jgi:hypothetical protein